MTYALEQVGTSCAAAVPLLEAFLDGELGPEQTISVEAHLEVCLVCAEHAQFLLSMSQSVSNAVHDDVQVRPEFLARLNRAVEAEVARETAQRAPHGSPWPTRAALAAAASMTLWLTLQEKGMLRVSDSDAPPAAVDEAATNAVSNGSAIPNGAIPNGAIPNGAIPNGAILKGSAVSNGSAVATAGAVHLAGNNVTGNQLVGNSAASDSELTLEGALDRLIDHHSSPPKPDVTNPALLPKYEPDVGVRLQLPRLDKYGARWEGANLVPVSNQRAASLRYQLDGHRVTLYVFNASKLRVRKHADRGSKIDNPIYVGRWRGYTVAAKEHFGTGYAIAGDMDDAAITEMMTAIH